VIKLSTAGPLRGKKRWGFLERATEIYIASTTGDEPIYVSPLWYVVKDRVVYTFIDQASAAEQNFHGKVSAVVAGGTHFGDAHGVMLKAIVPERIDDPALRDELQELALEKYFYPGHPYRQEFIDFGHYHDRRWYALVPNGTVSWDLRELAPLSAREKRYFPPEVGDRLVDGNGSGS
jgi:hypothetical protein